MAKVILKLPVACERTGKSRSSIYQGIADGTFPRPIKLGPRSVGWLEDEIDAWIQQRVEASRKQER